MANPTKPDIDYSYTGFQAEQQDFPFPGTQLDNDLAELKRGVDDTIDALLDVRRADGALKNKLVTADSLADELLLGIRTPTAWLTGTDYLVTDTVFVGSIVYRCLEAHESGVFATDLAAGKWEEIVDFTQAVDDAVGGVVADVEAARDQAVAAQGAAETAQGLAETAKTGAEAAAAATAADREAVGADRIAVAADAAAAAVDADDAAASAAAAAASASDAANRASTIAMPDPPVALSYVRRNAANDEYEVRTVTQARGDLLVDSWLQLNAVGDGVTDDTAAVEAWQTQSGLLFAPNGDYSVPGSLTAPTRPRIIVADNAKESGTELPFISIGKEPFKTLPKNYFFVQQATADRSDSTTAQIQRVVTTNDGHTNPKALRVFTWKQSGGGNQREWAISGEITNDDNTGAAAEGGTAISGVALKNAAGTGVMFGGHFQVKDQTDAATVGGIVGIECNIQANGADTNANRIGFDLIARSYDGGSSGAGEFTAGLRIRNSNTASGGKWLTALLIQDGNQTVPTGISISTSPGSTGVGLNDAGSKGVGIRMQGTYSSAAIQIPSAAYIAMEATNTIKTGYGITANIWGFYNGANERAGFDMTATPRLRIAGTAVVGARQTGWTTPSGTAQKGTFTTSTVTLENLAQNVKGIVDALIAHGLVGT